MLSMIAIITITTVTTPETIIIIFIIIIIFLKSIVVVRWKRVKVKVIVLGRKVNAFHRPTKL